MYNLHKDPPKRIYDFSSMQTRRISKTYFLSTNVTKLIFVKTKIAEMRNYYEEFTLAAVT